MFCFAYFFISEGLRRAEQLVLYNKALQLTVAALQLARSETTHGRLKVGFDVVRI